MLSRFSHPARSLPFLLLVLVLFPLPSSGADWVKVTYEPTVPSITRGYVETAISLSNELLAQNGLLPSEMISVFVSNGAEGYVDLLVKYGGIDKERAKEQAKRSEGVSVTSGPIVLIKGSSWIHTNQVGACWIVPHELFHQVQRQYGENKASIWIREGFPEVFRFMVTERAGLFSLQESLSKVENIVRKTKQIPDIRMLATSNYSTFRELNKQHYPAYSLSTLLAAQLVKQKGFSSVAKFYHLLGNGSSEGTAFHEAFGMPMDTYMSSMAPYLKGLSTAGISQ